MGENKDSTPLPDHNSYRVPRQGSHLAHVSAARFTQMSQDGVERQALLRDSVVTRQNTEGDYEEIEFDPPEPYWAAPTP